MSTLYKFTSRLSYENRMRIKSLSLKLLLLLLCGKRSLLLQATLPFRVRIKNHDENVCAFHRSRATHNKHLTTTPSTDRKKSTNFYFRRANRAKQKLRCWTQESELRENEEKKEKTANERRSTVNKEINYGFRIQGFFFLFSSQFSLTLSFRFYSACAYGLWTRIDTEKKASRRKHRKRWKA